MGNQITINKNSEYCPICKRKVPSEPYWEDHHLIPKSKKGKEKVRMCGLCHDAIHKAISNSDLKNKYNTIAMLLEHDKIKNWVKWISKKPNKWSVCFKEKK